MGFNPKSVRITFCSGTAAPRSSARYGLKSICLFSKMLVFLWLSLTFLVCPAFGGLISADFVPQLQLPDCSEAKQRSASLNSLVFVSTIDGRVSALDGANGGTEAWSIGTSPGPLLSSSIHDKELTDNAEWVRMIPSLSGGLYKFDGKNVEVIPVTADDLLHSSVKLSDDVTMTGGKELRTYGVDVLNGEILYECSLHGCENATNYNNNVEEVLLVQRTSQTVRAVNPRTSHERWNFSVAYHTLKLIPDPSALCHSSRSTTPLAIDLRIIAPEGLICAISRSDNRIIWKHKFDNPVVGAWTVDRGEMKEVDLFSGAQWASRNFEGHDDFPLSPSLYVGMHNRQLYIQESVQMQRLLNNFVPRYYRITDKTDFPRIPWHPVPASSNALGLVQSNPDTARDLAVNAEETAVIATSVLNASDYVNGNGFFLYSKKQFEKNKAPQCGVPGHNPEILGLPDNNTNEILGENSEEDSTAYTVIVAPLWYWWKEIVVISVTSALILNVFVYQPVFRYMRNLIMENRYEAKTLSPLEKKSDSGIQMMPTQELMRPPPYTEFSSLYLQEFQPVRCLGRGGFGVVFEARKKFDDCLYAVKRISLTNREESRERVLREVKALAKLDHNNIVRYFNSWLEQPPPGWQQQQDEKWSVLSAESGSEFPSVADDTSVFSNNKRSLTRSHRRSDSVCVEIPPCESRDSRHVRSLSDGDDSFIVFEASNEASKSQLLSRLSSQEDNEITSSHYRKKKKKKQSARSVCSSVRDQNIPTSYLFIQMQLCRRESLKEWLRGAPTRDYKIIVNFFDQIVHAVEYIHLNGLIHRDLKPSNIFFSMDGQIKVGDFGLVTTMLEDTDDRRAPADGSGSPIKQRGLHTAQVGTELYMSPEQRAGLHYNYKVDIYSLGLILFELLVPFGTEMERIYTLQDLRRHKFPDKFHKDYEHEHALLSLMLAEKPEARPTTIGIRSRPPLKPPGSPTDSDEHHFELPPRTRTSFPSTSSSSGSLDSSYTVVSSEGS